MPNDPVVDAERPRAIWRETMQSIDARWPDWHRRAGGLALALLLEGGLLLLLMTLGYTVAGQRDRADSLTTVDFAPEPSRENAAPEPMAEPSSAASPRPAPATQPDQSPPALPVPLPPPAAELATKSEPAPAPAAESPPRIRAVVRDASSGPAGPPNRGFRGDSERIGTAGNGEPLYRARWYREPTDQEMRGYLSTASGPGWALINCRTVPDYRVEDCELVDEWPNGSQMGRAVLASAWQFKVRPPQIGGRVIVGAWVRIRISYQIDRG